MTNAQHFFAETKESLLKSILFIGVAATIMGGFAGLSIIPGNLLTGAVLLILSVLLYYCFISARDKCLELGLI